MAAQIDREDAVESVAEAAPQRHRKPEARDGDVHDPGRENERRIGERRREHGCHADRNRAQLIRPGFDPAQQFRRKALAQQLAAAAPPDAVAGQGAEHRTHRGHQHRHRRPDDGLLGDNETDQRNIVDAGQQPEQ